MKKLSAATVLVVAFAFAPAALASQPTRAHVRDYVRTYASVRSKFGSRAPGCSLIARKGSCHKQVSDENVKASLVVLHRMLVPRLTLYTGRAVVLHRSSVSTVAPASGLANCIIQAESGGNPQATNGQYSGVAQWSPTSWANGGGTRYASSPLGATKAEQISVLNHMLADGQSGQWTPYDSC